MLSDELPVLPYEPRRANHRILDRAARVLQARSFWALADQGIASAANFFTIILVTRHLQPTEFGKFSLMWELLMFLNGLHASLIVYPLSVRGARLTADRMRQVSTAAMILSLLLAGPFGGSMFVLGAWQAITIGLWAALATAAFQLHETLRRALMSQFRYKQLIWGDAVGYLGQVGGVYVLTQNGSLSVQGVFACMTLSFCVAAIVQGFFLQIQPTDRRDTQLIGMEFWALGQWMLASNVITFFGGFGLQFWMSWVQDLTHVAHYQAMSNLVRFANPILTAMTGLILPAVAESGKVRAGQKYAVLGAILLAPYLGLLFLAPSFGVTILYGRNSVYAGYPFQVRITVMSAAMVFIAALLGAILGGLGRSKQFFITQVVNTAAMILLVYPAAVIYGWTGALVAVLITNFLTMVATVLLLWKHPHPLTRE